MDVAEVLARYDEQVRRRPVPGSPAGRVETADGVVRVIDPGGGWQGVTASDLDERTAEDAVAAQVAAFSATGLAWEWKHHSHDSPADLPARLLAAGFAAEEPETLLVAELTGPDALDVRTTPPPGVELVPVLDDGAVAALVALHDEVFGGDHGATGAALRAGMRADPATVAAVLAVADGRPVCAGRVELHHGTDFASLWGGGTAPAWRGRGVFRSVVAHRAALARDRGFRYLQVDATPMSRPVLERLGFVALATTTPHVHPGR